MPLLVTENLSLSFGGVKAADDLSLSVREGERLAIVGTNGAGKTTFINLVTGYVKPASGSIRFNNEDITELNSRQVVRIGIGRSFQIPQLFTSLTVSENLLVSLALKSRSRTLLKPLRSDAVAQKALEVLEQFSVADYAQSAVGTLPQGVRKLVDVAMAVAGGPRLIFLDEPTSGISSQDKGLQMSKVMQALESGKVTSILIEHDMSVVREYSTRVVAFHQGAIIADGAPMDVLRDEMVRKLIVGAG